MARQWHDVGALGCTLRTDTRIDAAFVGRLRSAPCSVSPSIIMRITATSFGPRSFACERMSN